MITRIRARPVHNSASEGRDELEALVRLSSDKMRQFLFAYLLLAVYIAAVVLSTTDRQLLLVEQGLKLPLIDLTVPLPGFYLVAPYFVLALHFNFLQNLANHHLKLMEWQRSWSGSVPASRISHFIFDFASLGRSTHFFPWVAAVSSFLCLYSAPALIAMLMWRFADYQSSTALYAHLAAIWIDLFFVSQARIAFIANDVGAGIANKSGGRFPNVNGFIQFIKAPISAGPTSHFSIIWGLSLCLLTLKVLVCWDVFIRDWDASFLRRHVAPELIEIGEDDQHVNNLFGLLPRIAIDKTDRLFKPDIARLKEQAELLGKRKWDLEFESRGMSLDIRGRSLRYLSVPFQVLPRLWAKHAQLQGADFSFARLQGSIMGSAQLQGARFDMAELDGAYLPNVNLRGASLINARLAGSYLDHAELQGANLTGAQMQAVFLYKSELQGANLSGADLTGAYVNRISVWGALTDGVDVTVLSDSDGVVPEIVNVSPSPIDVARWATDRPSQDEEDEYIQWMLGGNAAKARFFSLQTDNGGAVKKIVELACNDGPQLSQRLSRIALKRYIEYLVILNHPMYSQLSTALDSRNCADQPEPGKFTLPPVRKR